MPAAEKRRHAHALAIIVGNQSPPMIVATRLDTR
jgi:hypothetical protein